MELLDDRSDSECAVIEWCSFIWFGLVGPELTNWLSQKVDTMNNHKNHRKKQTHEHMKNRNPNMPLCFNSRFLVVEALRSRTLPSGPVEHRRSVAQVGLLPAFDDRCVLAFGRTGSTDREEAAAIWRRPLRVFGVLGGNGFRSMGGSGQFLFTN